MPRQPFHIVKDGEIPEFQPTPEQREAQRIVRGLVDEGFIAPPDWIQELRHRSEKSGTAMPFGSDDWRKWLALEGFEDWFYDGMYPKPSKHALRALNESWFSGLRSSLAKGEPRTLKWFYDTVLENADEGDEGTELVEAIRMNQEAPAWRKKK